MAYVAAVKTNKNLLFQNHKSRLVHLKRSPGSKVAPIALYQHQSETRARLSEYAYHGSGGSVIVFTTVFVLALLACSDEELLTANALPMIKLGFSYDVQQTYSMTTAKAIASYADDLHITMLACFLLMISVHTLARKS